MEKRITDAIPGIVDTLSRNKITDGYALLGFDACIDYIVRIVKDKSENNETGFFTSSGQFGQFLKDLDGRSCGVELNTKLSKIGGNMVITANAIGNLGINVECIGTFGFPDILPVFRTMSDKCTLYTIGDTISATALEFNESKVIMFDPGPYTNLHWKDIKDHLGFERLKKMFSGKQLISLLNWSEIENSSEIWEGVLDEVLPFVEMIGPHPSFFTDFSDCSRRSKQDIQFARDLLGRFMKYFNVILSLNQNEADLVAKAFDLSQNSSDEKFIKSLYSVCNSNVLIIHRVNDALAFDGKTFEKCDTFYCETPVILTGGGDNFNAGFCYSLFREFNLFQSLLVANAVSGSYVKTGISPGVNNLIEFLGQNISISDKE